MDCKCTADCQNKVYKLQAKIKKLKKKIKELKKEAEPTKQEYIPASTFASDLIHICEQALFHSNQARIYYSKNEIEQAESSLITMKKHIDIVIRSIDTDGYAVIELLNKYYGVLACHSINAYENTYGEVNGVLTIIKNYIIAYAEAKGAKNGPVA